MPKRQRDDLGVAHYRSARTCARCGVPATADRGECFACGHVWGSAHECPHCGVRLRAVRSEAFRWACPGCGGFRLPPRLVRSLTADPGGEVRAVSEGHDAAMAEARRARRVVVWVFAAVVVSAVGAVVAIVLESAIGAAVLASLCLLAVCAAFWARTRLGRANVMEVDARAEVRRTFRRVVAHVVRQEGLSDAEIDDLVQSTREVRRVRLSAGTAGRHDEPTSSPELEPEDEANTDAEAGTER